ncbi:MAG: calcium-binding protein [Pirellulales bacterium]
MALCTNAEAGWTRRHFAIYPPSGLDREQRIMRALAVSNRSIPRVDEAALSVYYQYLSANLSLPLVAHFPMPSTPQENAEFRCVVVKLLDPVKQLGDPLDGIFCKTRKGRYEVNLPLIDLYLPEESPDFRLIEDYWYWFWNWR